jgi:phosphoadenosine phosphosulfate reductase
MRMEFREGCMSVDIIRKILDQHNGRPCFTCSFQAEDVVLLDMLRKVWPDIPVLFLDTGYHFAETYKYRDKLARQWELNLFNIEPDISRDEQEAKYGKLYIGERDRCCNLRKVKPLLRALEGFEIWFTGLRREQSPTRANLALVETHILPSGKSLVKASPLAFWTGKEIWNYLRTNKINYLSLYDRGYSSIGCEPCTSLPLDPDNPRSGRWAGQKVECGIHTFNERNKN